MMEEEKRECKDEKRKVDSTTTLLRKEKGMVSSVRIFRKLSILYITIWCN